jgi:hypothetical protein
MENNSIMPSAQKSSDVITTKTVSQYVDRYKSYAKKTAEAIIGISTTLVEAKAVLKKKQFTEFRRQVQISRSMFKKMGVIGKAAPRLLPHLDRLPNAWTNLYELARLDPADFNNIMSEITPSITARMIKEKLGCTNHKPKDVAAQVGSVTIPLGEIAAEKRQLLMQELTALQQKYSFKLKGLPALLAANDSDVAIERPRLSI